MWRRMSGPYLSEGTIFEEKKLRAEQGVKDSGELVMLKIEHCRRYVIVITHR
jgi:hypothetical protein